MMGAAVFPPRHIPQLSQSMEYKHKKLKSPHLTGVGLRDEMPKKVNFCGLMC